MAIKVVAFGLLASLGLMMSPPLLAASSEHVAAAGEDVCFRAAPAHACLADTNAVENCEEHLKTDPFDIQVRYSLCEAHLQEDQLLKAWLVLDQGKELCGRNNFVCSRLQITLSNLEESSEKKVGDRSAAERGKAQARNESQRRICLRTMNGDLSLNACQELLLNFPEDAALHSALGVKLMNRERPAQAIQSLRRALKLGAQADAIQSTLDQAEAARVTLSQQCLSGQNLDVCNRALLVGTADETQLHLRRATLLKNNGDLLAAINAVLSAQALQPTDRSVASELVKLVSNNKTRALQGSAQDNANLYFAQGKAQRVLANTEEAIRSFQRARQLDPGLAEVDALLRKVQSDRRSKVQKLCLSKQNVRACERLLANLSDTPVIESHIADIKRQQAKVKMAALAEQFEKSKPAAVPAPTVPAQTVSTQSEPSTPKPKGKLPTVASVAKKAPDLASISHNNLTNAQGQTY